MTEETQDPGVPVEKTFAKYTELHTPGNTPMGNRVPPESVVIRPLTDKEKEDGMITIFLGNSKEVREHSNALMEPYIEMLTLRQMVERNNDYLPALRKKEEEWQSFAAEHYPSFSPEALEERAGKMVGFYSEFLDDLRVRSNAIREDGISNLSDRGGLFSPDVSGRKPGRDVKNMKDSDIMRRRVINSEDGRLVFDVELRNSFVKLSFLRPSKMDMGNLVNDIRSAIKGYVRRVNNNSATLARIAAGRVIWDFIAKRITYASVSNIGDFRQLASVIRWADIDVLTTALLRAYTNKGVHMHLVCASPSCDWEGFELVDVERLVHHRDAHDTAEESAIYGNLFNHKVTYTIEETMDLIKKAKFGVDTTRVANDDDSIYFELGSPSLANAFQTFDYFSSRVSGELQDLRTKVLDPEEYETQRNMIYTSLGATEYIHWIDKFVAVGTPNTDEPDTVLSRDNAKDQDDFNMGLVEAIKDSTQFNSRLTSAIFNKTPYLSKTFCGIDNFVCPKCKAKREALEDPENIKERKFGYTPIDPIMSFFTHVQLLLMAEATDGLNARVKALSQ